jgi:hypothetical protein
VSLAAFRPSLGAARAADLMRMRDAERLVGIKAEARLANSRERQLRAVGARLQPLFERLAYDLRARKAEAAQHGRLVHAAGVELEIDALVDEFNLLARNIVEDLR